MAEGLISPGTGRSYDDYERAVAEGRVEGFPSYEEWQTMVPVCSQCGEARRDLPPDYQCREGAWTGYVAS